MFRRVALLILPFALLHADDVDYSKEAVVFENVRTVVHFSADGTYDSVQTVAVKVQSEGAVRRFGILSVAYASGSKSELVYARVRKPDGKVVETSPSETIDVASEVAQIAPMYSDVRQQQLPVRALAVGDVLEYSIHTTRFQPEIPNQYWFSFNFDHSSVVLSQDLEVYTVSNKYINVASRSLSPQITDQGSTRRYAWHYEQRKPTPSEPDKVPARSVLPRPDDIQISTFHSWQELGTWYSGLLAPRRKVTPAIAAKAAEITKGLSTPEQKAHALYEYVALRYRYISLSFGIGHYAPHKGEEVLLNGYGDCKDKHTLLLTLLRASGIEASTVLIGSGLAFDASIPSPAQFNHVITSVRLGGRVDWLDTTAETAPYGLLLGEIRDQEALVIGPDGIASVEKTPADPPFASAESVHVESTLDKDGVLTGHFDMTFHGETEWALRAAYRSSAPAQWTEVTQSLVHSLSFLGDVTNVVIENVGDLAKPLHISYDYKRVNYSDWSHHQIAAPLPPISIPYEGDDVKKPADDIRLPAPGKTEYHAVVHLPKEFQLTPEADTTTAFPFGDYRATYSVKDGILTVDRVLEVKHSKVALAEWDNYRKLCSALYTDHSRWMTLADDNPALTSNKQSDEAAALIVKAMQAWQSQDLYAADADLAKAKAINPKQLNLWSALAGIAAQRGALSEAVTDLKKEIEYHPENRNAYSAALYVFRLQKDEASSIAILQSELKQFPHDEPTLDGLASLLAFNKRWSELASLFDPESRASESARTNSFLVGKYIGALLHTGRTAEGLALARKAAAEEKEPVYFNNLAWELADSETDLNLAAEYARAALDKFHERTQSSDLDHFQSADIVRSNQLVATWDTTGWIQFKLGKLSEPSGM